MVSFTTETEELGTQVFVTIFNKHFKLFRKMPQSFGAFFLYINLIFGILQKNENLCTQPFNLSILIGLI